MEEKKEVVCKLWSLFVLLFLCIGTQARQTLPKHEIRAVWLTTIGGIDWPHTYQAEAQKAELQKTLDKLRQAGINTVLLQTRVRGTTIYPSAIEPWDGCITGHPGQAASYDPLQFAIEECHKRGMQLHAWIVTIPIGKWNKTGCTQLRKRYPNLVKRIKDEGYMDPERKETADYLARICREVAERYDIDGIHLDYIRYPETWKLKVSRDQGRRHITHIVSTVSRAVKNVKPWLILSCAPIGKHDNLQRYSSGGWNARTAVCQDAQQWLKEGLMDALFPMMYFRDNQFYPFAIDWQEHSYGRFVVPGLGIYFLDPQEGKWTLDIVERQLNVVRQLGMGHCYFRSKFFTDNVKGIYDLGKRHNGIPAIIPPMWWACNTPPDPPAHLVLNEGTLSWDETKAERQDDYLVYNIYASENYPVDVENAENLMTTRIMQCKLKVPLDKRRFYAVTAQNRYGLESKAAQLDGDNDPKVVPLERRRILMTDGRVALLPKKPSTLDADYIIIETLEGRQVAVVPYKGKYIDIDGLACGVYQWRSLGRKGRNHRMGFFAVKRTP
jgi:hypothetical protein